MNPDLANPTSSRPALFNDPYSNNRHARYISSEQAIKLDENAKTTPEQCKWKIEPFLAVCPDCDYEGMTNVVKK